MENFWEHRMKQELMKYVENIKTDLAVMGVNMLEASECLEEHLNCFYVLFPENYKMTKNGHYYGSEVVLRVWISESLRRGKNLAECVYNIERNDGFILYKFQ
jgi:hypothetical protein